jgi:hypothetical protein
MNTDKKSCAFFTGYGKRWTSEAESDTELCRVSPIIFGLFILAAK